MRMRKKRKTMSKNAVKRAKELTWNRYGERVIEAYQKILDSR